MQGKHETKKSKTDSTYSAQWSGVSYAPTIRGEMCEKCGGHLHRESDNKYCPYCDDYVKGAKGRPTH